jgi:hypothetical protein
MRGNASNNRSPPVRTFPRLAVLLAALLAAPLSANAMKVPMPEGSTMNISFQLQTQAIFNENATPDGTGWATDIFVRRSRLLINGDVGQNFSYLIQFDNPNFGKQNNFTGRGYMQDAWVGWAPLGREGGTVIYIDAGLLLIPISHHLLESTTNFVTADVHTDSFRLRGAPPGLRDTGVQIRGWALDKKLGFRGGVYEGIRSVTNGTGTAVDNTTPLNPKSLPRFAGFVNFDILGSEEGGWLYGAYRWKSEPVLSVGVSGIEQSQVIRAPLGRADQQVFSADVYANFPIGGEESEVVLEATGYLNNNGTGSADSGLGYFVDLGYRNGIYGIYASYDGFSAKSCPDTTTLAAAACKSGTLDSNNFRFGLNFFFAKNTNHLNLEFSLNNGQSAYGAQSVNYATSGTAQPPSHATSNPNSTVAGDNTTTKSILLHWNTIF